LRVDVDASGGGARAITTQSPPPTQGHEVRTTLTHNLAVPEQGVIAATLAAVATAIVLQHPLAQSLVLGTAGALA
jgi:hypothetical protein